MTAAARRLILRAMPDPAPPPAWTRPLRRATTTFENEVDIAVAPSQVADFLGDFANFARIHPLIVDIAQGRPRPEAPAGPARRWYKVTDRLPLGPIPIYIRYDVALADGGPQALLFEAWQWPRIHLYNRISWQALPQGGTRVREELTLQAPGLLVALVGRMAQAAHAESFARLKARLEAEK